MPAADPRVLPLVPLAVGALRAGGLVVAPTDTLLGLLADPFHPGALERLGRLKDRPADEPYPLILPSVAAVDRVAVGLAGPARLAAERFWPGPLGLLLPARAGLPAAVVGSGGRVAVRVPGDSPAALLCRSFGGPLVATSANRRGGPPPVSEGALDPGVAEAAAVVLPGAAAGALASTLVAFDDGGGYRIVRVGAVSAAELAAVLGPPSP